MSVALVFFLLTMTSLALIAAVKLLYARGDMDLLLASPVPARSIIIVRAVFIALSLLGFSGLLILPFANVFAVLGYPKFLAAYVVLTSLALLATSFGLAMAQGMFHLLGARRDAAVGTNHRRDAHAWLYFRHPASEHPVG